VLGEFGDDPNRNTDVRARRNYAGTSPITKASGKSRVVLARYARNPRLSDACYLWAFAATNARAFYNARRDAGDTHNRALQPWPTGSSASSTAASNTTPPTTNTPPGPTVRHKLLDNLYPWDV
jgi:hypothetical protein